MSTISGKDKKQYTAVNTTQQRGKISKTCKHFINNN